MEIVTKEETRTPATKMAMATSGSDLKVPSLAIPADDRGEIEKESVSTVKKRQKPGRKLNGIVKGDTRSMYISPSKCKNVFGQSVVEMQIGLGVCTVSLV